MKELLVKKLQKWCFLHNFYKIDYTDGIGIGIDFKKIGIWDGVWQIRDLGFGMEFGKFGIWDWDLGLGANHFGIGIPNADL